MEARQNHSYRYPFTADPMEVLMTSRNRTYLQYTHPIGYRHRLRSIRSLPEAFAPLDTLAKQNPLDVALAAHAAMEPCWPRGSTKKGSYRYRTAAPSTCPSKNFSTPPKVPWGHGNSQAAAAPLQQVIRDRFSYQILRVPIHCRCRPSSQSAPVLTVS